jgi:plastocyanin
VRALRVATVAVAGLLAAAGTADAATVRVGDNWFSPKRLTVEQHSSVTWKFVGDRTHRVKVTSGPDRFKSPRKSSGKYVRHLMYRGTYKVVCTIHRGDQKMTLVVE